MSAEKNFDLIVIGAGPGGYVAAIRGAQLGMKVACVEKEKSLGGTCLNVGCIPSKALLESSEWVAQVQEKFPEHGIAVKSVSVDLTKMMARKQGIVEQLTGGVDFLFKKNKVERFFGTARLQDPSTVVVEGRDAAILKAPRILIATGSTPVHLKGVPVDQKHIVDSTGALALEKIPDHLVVLGGGYIGLELGSVYRRLGSRVTVVEALDRIAAGMDGEAVKLFYRLLKKQGLEFRLETKLTSAQVKKNQVLIQLEDKNKNTETLEADVLLVSIGRRPYTQNLGLESLGVKTDARGCIEVDGNFQSSVPGIYAVGDVIEGPMLAHKASEEGVVCVERMMGHASQLNYESIPAVVYTHPEVASVGLTEEQAKERGIDYLASKFPFSANGRALALGEKEGWVKLIAHKATKRILGAHIVGPRASELIAELGLAKNFSANAEDIGLTIHAHPTLAEAVKEAALGLEGGMIHG